MYTSRSYRSLAAQARGPGAMIGHASVVVFSGSGFAGLENGAFYRFYGAFGPFDSFCMFYDAFCLKMKETRAFLSKNLMVRELDSTKTANFQRSTVILFFMDRAKPRVSSISKQKELLFVQKARRSREINAFSLRKREFICPEEIEMGIVEGYRLKGDSSFDCKRQGRESQRVTG